MKKRIDVDWQSRLDAYQGFEPDDSELTPLFAVDTGDVTCEALLGPGVADALRADGRLLPLPVKGAARSWAQRKAFAETLCDRELAADLEEAPSWHNPFLAFDTILERVPVEHARWVEHQRLEDLEALWRWLDRSGYAPEPAPVMRRTILEFPRRI